MRGLPKEISNASSKPSIQVGILLKHVFSRATEFILEVGKLLFDAED